MGMDVRIGEDAARLVEKMVASGPIRLGRRGRRARPRRAGAERAVWRGGDRLAPWGVGEGRGERERWSARYRLLQGWSSPSSGRGGN